MTAYGFKHGGGAEGMAEGHPWGMCPHLIFKRSDLYSQGGWENQLTLPVWVSIPMLISALTCVYFPSVVLGESCFVLRDGRTHHP